MLCDHCKNLSLYFEGFPPSRRSIGSYVVGEIPLYFYVPMFPWKDFLMGRIKEIQKHKEKRDKLGKFKKTRKKEWRGKKKDFYIHEGSHTHVFSINRECPWDNALMQPSLKKMHSYGNLSYNIIFMVHMYFVGKGGKFFKIIWT